MKTSQKGIKGLLTEKGMYDKHLRPAYKRIFWKTERGKQKESIVKEIKEEL